MPEKVENAPRDGAARARPRRRGERAPQGPQGTVGRGAAGEPIFDVQHVDVFYGTHKAVADVNFKLPHRQITALIGPSGCGKSTFIRCLNRMNDLIASARVDGKIIYHGQDLYASNIDPVQVRKRIGMVFQKPNPFPKSIYDNIAFGPRLLGVKGNMDEIVERALQARRALGRGQGPPEDERVRHVRRPAAAPLHRPRAGHRARRAADG